MSEKSRVVLKWDGISYTSDDLVYISLKECAVYGADFCSYDLDKNRKMLVIWSSMGTLYVPFACLSFYHVGVIDGKAFIGGNYYSEAQLMTIGNAEAAQLFGGWCEAFVVDRRRNVVRFNCLDSGRTKQLLQVPFDRICQYRF